MGKVRVAPLKYLLNSRKTIISAFLLEKHVTRQRQINRKKDGRAAQLRS
jgi:hypothetical protein